MKDQEPTAPHATAIEEQDDDEAGSLAPSITSLQNVEEGREDVTLAMSDSIKDVYMDMEPPLQDRSNLRITTDTEDIILKNALRNVKSNMDEARVMSEVRKMYDLYLQSQAANHILSTKIDRYLEKIDKYEARHRRDPRVMVALKMAEKHRNALKLADEAMKDLEAEKIEAKLEVKHLEDMMRNKNRELTKVQEESRKLRDVEKSAEICETQLIKRENELRTLQERFEVELAHAKAAIKEEFMRELALRREQQEREVKEAMPDMKRCEYDMAERRFMQREIDEKSKIIHLLEIDNKSKKVQINSCRDRARVQAVTIRLMMRKNAQMRKEKLSAENENIKWKILYETLKNEFDKAEEQLKESKSTIYFLKAQVRKETEENHRWKTHSGSRLLNRPNKGSVSQDDEDSLQFTRVVQQLGFSLRDTQKKLTNTGQSLGACHHISTILQKDLKVKDKDLGKTTHHLQEKTMAHDNLSKKCNMMQQQKLEQMDLLRMSQGHAMVLAKDVAGLRQETVKQYKNYQDLLADRARLRANLFLIKSHYYEAEDRCQVLRNEKEMQKFYADQLEQQAVEMQRKLQSIVQTNIQLYCENTTQEEVAVLQNNQYKIKEKEIQGLEFSSQEQNEVIAKLEQTCKEKTHTVEQLSVDVITLGAQVKAYRTQVQTLTNEERTLRCHLVQMVEKEKGYLTSLDLLRRQRDLFGTQLLRSQAEMGLEKQRSRVSDSVMVNAAVAHRNLLNDLKLLKLEIRDLRRKLRIQDGNSLMIDSLRQELAKFSSALELEMAKSRTLEATRVPIIHRWRALMASDPSKYEMFMKMSRLTKRLIDKTTESAEKELIIQEKDFYMLQIQSLIARRSLPEMKPELNQAKAVIRKQTRQLQALQGELNIAKHDLVDQNNVIEKHHDSLLDAKKNTVKQQRINRKLMTRNVGRVKLPSLYPKVIRTYQFSGS